MHLPKYENKPFKPPRKIGINKSINKPSTNKFNTLTRIASRAATSQRAASRAATSQRAASRAATSQRAASQPITSGTTATVTTTSQHQINLDQNVQCFTIMYRKQTNKKNKTWNGDGYAIFKKLPQMKLIFYNDSGQYMTTSIINQWDDSIIYDTIFKNKGWEFQLDYKLIKDNELNYLKDLLKSKNDNNPSISQTSDTPKQSSIIPKSRTPTNGVAKSSIPVSQLFQKNTLRSFKNVLNKSEIYTPLSLTKKTIHNNIKLIDQTQRQKAPERQYKPIFDITKIQDPIIMNKSKDVDVDIIIDPLLGKALRQHQREGVKFIYDCLMGFQQPINDHQPVPIGKSLLLESDSDISGCLLADDMGLGKTLMTITIIWTLLKQNPFASRVECSQNGVPLIGLCKKVLIVCPVTLIGNWVKEFHKWLGRNRIGILTLHSNNTVDMDKTAVINFLRVQRSYQILIIGYEKLLNLVDDLNNKQGSAMNIDLLICDEGHRLKNSSSKILNALKDLDINKKILLSGTPIQNDLTEFYTIVDFINPGILGSFPHFKKRYITPITRARETSNSLNEDIQEIGEDRSQELIDITKRFTLRRTNDILNKYLPPRTDIILFCKPTKIQVSVFNDILQHTQLDFQHMTMNSSLGLITLMKKICNSPSLLNNDSYYNSNIQDDKIKWKYSNTIDSGKLKVLISLLENIKTESPQEKVVIVSNYTQTLDIIQNILASKQLITTRLDGSTPQNQRDSIVNVFNRSKNVFAFLLSAKSGGVGLNLIGASRLILFDNDWNPSVDLQAMSRIHRQGQKRHCYIYRLVTTGCIDEKILQRQLMKHSLSQKFLDSSNLDKKGNTKDNLFSKEDLKDLFTILTDTKSNTHDLICSCSGTGEAIMENENTIMEDAKIVQDKQDRIQLSGWTTGLDAKKIIDQFESREKEKKTKFIKKCLVGYKHIDPTKTIDVDDMILSRCINETNDPVSFVFEKPGSVFDE